MTKKILLIISTIIISSCASLKDKMPERQVCTGDETNKTLTEVFCKKN